MECGEKMRPCVLFEDGRAGHSLVFDTPQCIFVAHAPAEVAPALAGMEEARRKGLHLAGYAAFELGYALEPRLAGSFHRPRTPLLLFGAFATPRRHHRPDETPDEPFVAMTPDWSFADYARRFGKVIDYIRAGDVYQINLTFPLRGRYDGEPLALYASLRRRQPVRYGGIVSLGAETVLSLSPELFFETEGRMIRTRPMKGTAPRGANAEEDTQFAAALSASEKNRAENLMIVDLLRNDLSRLAEAGSVRVTDLFTVETYPTLHQMTSGIEARQRTGGRLADFFACLFPCGSVTGTPKIRAMEIIRDLEGVPRNVYCGSLGHIAPNGDMRFNVAIRTATLYDNGDLTCNVGSAIVYDSDARAEYDECLLKATFLTGPQKISA
jgi:aminodeoxychorismate synthase component I